MGVEGSRSRAARVASLAVPLLVVGAVVALRPEIARGTVSSPASAARVAAVAAGWLGLSALVRRLVQPAPARLAILGVAGSALIWLTVVPYFQEETVDDRFPAAAAPIEAVSAAAPVAAPPAATPSAPVTAIPGTPAEEPAAAAVGPARLGAGT